MLSRAKRSYEVASQSLLNRDYRDQVDYNLFYPLYQQMLNRQDKHQFREIPKSPHSSSAINYACCAD